MTKRGREEGRETPTSLEQASAAAARYAVPKWLAALTASREGISQLGIAK